MSFVFDKHYSDYLTQVKRILDVFEHLSLDAIFITRCREYITITYNEDLHRVYPYPEDFPSLREYLDNLSNFDTVMMATGIAFVNNIWKTYNNCDRIEPRMHDAYGQVLDDLPECDEVQIMEPNGITIDLEPKTWKGFTFPTFFFNIYDIGHTYDFISEGFLMSPSQHIYGCDNMIADVDAESCCHKRFAPIMTIDNFVEFFTIHAAKIVDVTNDSPPYDQLIWFTRVN